MSMPFSLRIPCLAALCWFAGCATPTPPSATDGSPAAASATEMVAAIRAAGIAGADELAVQPLRDPAVEDLRQEAQRLEAAGRLADAAGALDRAIEIVTDDPALLQERAELALLSGDPALAGALAERAHRLGSQVGPLCRRHWATIAQVRLHARDAEGAAAATGSIDACTLAPPPRY
jgi:Flp pilus assembly protein TadD